MDMKIRLRKIFLNFFQKCCCKFAFFASIYMKGFLRWFCPEPLCRKTADTSSYTQAAVSATECAAIYKGGVPGKGNSAFVL